MAFLQRNTTIYNGTFFNVICNKPSGTIEGDLMVAWICGDSAFRRNVTPPSGWSVIYNQSSPDLGGGAQQFGYYKVATASEPSSYTFVFSGSVGSLKGVLTSYYDTNGTGTWTASSIGGGGNFVNSTSITSLSITGAGLYITAFLNDTAYTPTTDNSPVAEIAADSTNSLGFITYGGDYTALNHTITQTWSSGDDLYANNVIFAHQVSGGGFVSKIRVGSAYKNILEGYVAVDSNSSGTPDVWKKIVSGSIKASETKYKDIFK